MDKRSSNMSLGQPRNTLFTTAVGEGFFAVFICAFVALNIAASFVVGFNLYIYLAAMLPAAVLAFARPRAGLYALIFLTFIFERFFTLQPLVIGREVYKFYPIDAIFGALLLGTAVQYLTQKIKWSWRKSDYLVLIFMLLAFGYFAISVAFLHANFALAFSSFKNYAIYPLIYFAVQILFQNKTQLQKIAQWGFFGALAVILFILIGIVRGEGLWSEFTPLSTAGVRILAFPHAFYLSLAFLGLLTHGLVAKRIENQYFILTLIWLVGIIGSMMRHLWVSIVLAVIALYFILPPAARQRGRQMIGRYAAVVVLVLCVVISVAGIFPQSAFSQKSGLAIANLEDRVFSITSSTDESILWRKELWKKSFGSYGEKLWLGIGLGQQLSIEIGNYRDIVEVRNIHNSLLAILMQMGVLGLLIFLWIPAAAIKQGWPLAKDDYLGYALVAMLIFQLAAFMFQPYLEANLLGIFFWIILGLMRVTNNEKSNT